MSSAGTGVTDSEIETLRGLARLTGRVAHDFNNLLATVVASAELLEGELDETSKREALQDIRCATAMGRKLVRQLMAFGGQQVLQPMVLELSTEVNTVVTELRRVLPANVTLASRCEDSTLCVRVDPTQVRAAIGALVENALLAMPNGGHLTIDVEAIELLGLPNARASEAMSHVMLAVTDTGVGMDETTRAHALEPFFTTHEGRDGMGLAAVMGMVRQTGGLMRIDSAPAEGTTVALYFPHVTSAQSGARQAVKPSSFPRSSNGQTILLVDDDGALRRAVRRLLQTAGYEVVEAASGDEALEALRELDGVISLVLTDVVMPGMNGVELAERLAELSPDTAVLLTSGHATDILTRRAGQHGLLPFVQKPATKEELLSAIGAAIDSASCVA